ncbi:MAG: ADOP family duplicated permease [Bryobacteraceae bacterium]
MGYQKVNAWISGRIALLRHFRSDQDLKDELQSHLELYAEDGAGVTPQEARRRAHLAMGSTASIVENVRDQEFITILESWWQDFVLGVRGLRKNPVFCLTAILTLGIGIGANTAIFTLLHGLLLRSLPVEEPQQLARIGLVSAQAGQIRPWIPYRMIQHLRTEQQSFSGISAWSLNSVVVDDREGTLRWYQAGLAGGNAFELLGMKAHAGRLINESDDVPGGPPGGWPVVLSHGFWRDRFGADPEVLGRTFQVSNRLAIVMGVAPRGFNGLWPGHDPKLYLPIQFVNVLAERDILSPQYSTFCSTIARLRSGASLSEAAAELAVRQPALFREYISPEWRSSPEAKGARLAIESARTGLPTMFGQTYSGPLYLMQGLVAIVLLLCCVNISGLMMSKIHERQREFAIRTAIGAARWRLIRQYLTESFVIALAGAGLGALAAWYGSGLLLPFFRHPNWGAGVSLEPDNTVFLVTALLAVTTTLFFGLLPAFRAGRSDPGTLLKSRTASGRRRIAGRAFVPIQVSLSVVLVTLAALLSQSLIRLRGESTGFDVDHVTIQTPPIHRLGLKEEARLDLYQRMVDRMERSIRSAAVTYLTPMTGVQPTAAFEALTGRSAASENVRVPYNEVGPGYFRTMRTNIVAGREFAKHERRRDVCVLNQSAASLLFPRQQALGRYVRSAGIKEFRETLTCLVIGIAEDAKFGNLNEPLPRTIYFPVAEYSLQRGVNLVFLMNAAEKAQAIAAYREALQEIAPSVPLVLFVTLREQMDAALGSQIVITKLGSFFGAMALFLSAIGLYGLLSSSVAQRTAEIGVRIAIGAQRSAVLRMILSDALRLVGVGIAIGAVGLYLAVQSVKSMLYGVSAFDVPTLVATGMVLAFVGLMAGLMPALRAASVDPIQALRAE